MSPPKSSNTSSETPKASTKKTASARKIVLPVLLAAMVMAVSFLILLANHDANTTGYICTNQASKNIYRADGTIQTPNGQTIVFERLDTPQSRADGLSGRECMSREQAMLFVFDAPYRPGIWMKDMLFPIDIVWLDEAKRIVSIERNVSPNTYPTIFYPTADAQYVIEMAAGGVSLFGMDSGMQLSW